MAHSISRTIDNDETLLRCIVHPMFYSESKGTMKREVFLPPPDRRDVSLLRRDFTKDDSFCKNHCKSIKIGGSEYVGIAVFLARHVQQINDSEQTTISIELIATPLNPNKEMIPEQEEIFMNTSGLPMHADMIYERPLKKGIPATEHQIVASMLLKKATFYIDKFIESSTWNGSDLVWIEN